jgi:hypothetical protein
MNHKKQGTVIAVLHLDQEVLAHDAIELRRPGGRGHRPTRQFVK